MIISHPCVLKYLLVYFSKLYYVSASSTENQDLFTDLHDLGKGLIYNVYII